MNRHSDPAVDVWYRQESPDRLFQVVAIDRKDDTIEVQEADGRVQVIGLTAWRDLQVRETEAPVSGEDRRPELPFRPVLEQYEKAAERLAVRIGRAAAAQRQRTHGACESCGDPIDAKRLAAKPDASRCIACQRAFEAGALPVSA